mmetsp:Transcript_28612/g.42299  ORF Transcript_28612/g.42299 Transcript_28612/m.42299 type:complete len:111 (-) Transcript_28612:50-382(-)
MIPSVRRTVTPRMFWRMISKATSSFSTNIDPRKKKYYFKTEEPKYLHGKHRSNALDLIEKQDIIEVEGEMAICDGGGGSLGHPLEYISLERPGATVSCVYCGLKFRSKPH